MSITNDFEKKKTRIGDYWVSEDAYKPDDVDALLAHARALEAMLEEVRDDVCDCANLQLQYESYRPDRATSTIERLERLDKLIEGVNNETNDV